MTKEIKAREGSRTSFLRRHPKIKYIKQNSGLYFMLLPAMLTLVLFSYIPMYGLYMAFINYNPMEPNLFNNTYMGLDWFRAVFSEPMLWTMVRNTLILSFLKLLICFPAPIVLAILINEITNKAFKSIFQSFSYLPNFISWVIISGMLLIFLNTDNGIFNKIIIAFNGKPVSWYSDASKWRAILTITSLWKTVGWGSIMFLAAITAIDKQLYEAAEVDGAGKLKQVFIVTIPLIAPTITIVFILTIGKLFQDDFDQIYSLAGNIPILSETTQVISTRVYSFVTGGAYKEFPKATAYGLIQGVISLVLIFVSNKIVTKVGGEGVW